MRYGQLGYLYFLSMTCVLQADLQAEKAKTTKLTAGNGNLTKVQEELAKAKEHTPFQTQAHCDPFYAILVGGHQ